MIIFIGKSDDLYLIEDKIEQESYEIVSDVIDINIVVNRYKNATHYSQIIINIDLFHNPPSEIANALFLLKSTNSTNIIVIAQGYCVGDELLSELVANDIYNFVLTHDKESSKIELDNCFIGNELNDVRHYINEETLEKRSLFRFKKSTYPTVTIGICGICNRMGTTTQALRLVKSIADSDFTVCYCELNSNEHVEFMKNVYPNAKYRGGYIEYEGLNLYYKSKPNPVSYNYIVYDCGTDISLLADCDLKIVVAGCTAWEMYLLPDLFNSLNDSSDTSFIFSFVSKSEQDDILDFMDTRWTTTYFAEYSPDMFAPISENEKELYNKIININQPKTRTIKPVEQTKSKFSLFKKA